MVENKDPQAASQTADKTVVKPTVAKTTKAKATPSQTKSTQAKKTRARPAAVKAKTTTPSATKAKPQAAIRAVKQWHALIAACFGEKNKYFAKHATDKDNAYKLLNVLREENVSWKEFRKEVKRFLSKKVQKDHL